MNTAPQHSISVTDGTRDESGKVGQGSTTTISAVIQVREEPCDEASGRMQQGKVRATVARSTTSSSSKEESMRKLNLYKQKEIDLRRQLIELELESVKLQQSRIEQEGMMMKKKSILSRMRPTHRRWSITLYRGWTNESGRRTLT